MQVLCYRKIYTYVFPYARNAAARNGMHIFSCRPAVLYSMLCKKKKMGAHTIVLSAVWYSTYIVPAGTAKTITHQGLLTPCTYCTLRRTVL